MKIDVTIPAVGESISDGLLASWSAADGAHVIEGQAILEFETDKTTIDVTAPATGTLIRQAEEGTDVEVGRVVAVIDTEAAPHPAGEDAAAAEQNTRPAETPPKPEVPTDAAKTSGAEDRITPAAKSAAEAVGLEAAALSGTGRRGLVTKEDVAAAAESEAESTAGRPPQDRGERAAAEPEEIRKPMSRIRKAIAANLARTRDELVLLTTFNEADMSAVKELRSRHGEAFREKHGVKLGFMSFFLKASASALETFPEVNACIDGDEVVYRKGVHISVAVSTPKGLITPVVRDVGELGFADIEKRIAEFGRKAVEKTLMPEDLAGGTFTVTNGGVFGSMMSTPLPAPKQTAVLGMHAVVERPIAVDGAVVVRPMMYLALSYDHRLVDGREAVGFLKAVKQAIENPERLMLEI